MDLQHPQMTAAKSHGYHLQIAGFSMDKEQTQCRLDTQEKMEDVHKLLKIPKSECPDISDSSTRTQTALFVFQYGRPSRFLLKGICMVILW